MRYLTIYEGEEEFTFYYNFDLSGNVVIVKGYGDSSQRIEIPGKALLDFVANWVRNQRIAVLEEQGTDEVLGLGSGEA